MPVGHSPIAHAIMRTHMLVAITREISRSLQACELTHLARTGIDLPLAYAQHERYRGALEELGCRVLSLPAADELPDAVFVEDTAVVLDEVAIVTRPGAASRRGETTSIAEALRSYRPVVQIEEPGTLEGGDRPQVGAPDIRRRVRTQQSAGHRATCLAGRALRLLGDGSARLGMPPPEVCRDRGRARFASRKSSVGRPVPLQRIRRP